MKKIFCLIALSICALTVILSCDNPLSQESEFNEFQIKCKDGTVRSGAIYLPKGIKSNDKLPVIYMADGLIFKDCKYRKLMDSLVDNKCISPVVIVCSYENKMTVPGYRMAYRNAEYVEAIAKDDNTLATLFDNHYNYFINEFIPYAEKNAPISQKSDDRVFYGTSNSADFGITLSLRNPGLISEYWCFSPVYSDIRDYGLIEAPTSYRICWGAKEEVNMFDYFPNLLKDIRKRGGNVHSWTFNGGHDRGQWRIWFGEELKRRFPDKVN